MTARAAVQNLVRALLFGVLVVVAAPTADAQETPRQDVSPAVLPELGVAKKPANFANGDAVEAKVGGDPAPAEVDYTTWEKDAARAETALSETTTTGVTMELIRAQLADWRSAFLVAQSTNSARIATLRQQIEALGPVPAEGEAEAGEIAARRTALNEQLTRLQAPGLAADEAYRRADGLIREIDRAMRERQADALLQLLPSPINPANWPEAARTVSGSVAGLWQEVALKWARPTSRETLLDNLPAILLLLVIAVGLIGRGRPIVERFVTNYTARPDARGRRISALLLSLGQILLPLIGVVALSHLLQLTGLLGIVGTVLVESLPGVGFLVLVAYWLGTQLFPKDDTFQPLSLPSEARAEGRLVSVLYGSVLGLDLLRGAIIDQQALTEASQSVLAFPTILVAGVLLVRMGRLFGLHAQTADKSADDGGFRDGLIGLVGRGALIVGFFGPVLGAVGYISAAEALIFPAATSLGIIGLLFILQVVVNDIYALLTRSDDGAQKALVPVLVSFALVLAALPLFALIWGARLSDLTELWTRFSEGFQLGETRISPTNFLVFAVLFAIGFTVTRLFQGALKGSVLPRTKMDQGARNAIVSGVGYIGIFLAALIAINSAGIDLSSLAIVAGALSVGIGFGLQNIVSNFVSGIILLIERPVSEGDWIEVGGVHGTVKAISVRSTRIQTFDRTDVIVPNNDLIAGQVTNWTRFNLTGRLIVPVGVAYGTDTRLVERVLREIAEAQPLAILTPPPSITFMSFGADSMNFEIRVILRDVNFSLSVRTEINHQIVKRFQEEGIEIPFAQSEITVRNAADIAQLFRDATAAGQSNTDTKAKPPDALRKATRSARAPDEKA